MERPEFLVLKGGWDPPPRQARHHGRHKITQAVEPLPAVELLPHAIEDDDRLRQDVSARAHAYSANLYSARWKTSQPAKSVTNDSTPAMASGMTGGSAP